MQPRDRIRECLREKFLQPARLQGLTSIRIVAGEIHKELGLRNQDPNDCQVLRSQKFLNENRLVLEKFAAVVGVSNLHVYAAMRGQTLEELLNHLREEIRKQVVGEQNPGNA